MMVYSFDLPDLIACTCNSLYHNCVLLLLVNHVCMLPLSFFFVLLAKSIVICFMSINLIVLYCIVYIPHPGDHFLPFPLWKVN